MLAELNVRGQELRVVGMHLDLSGLWRKRQVMRILDHIARRHRPMPTVIMGDTNEWSKAGGVLREFDGRYEMANTGLSFHARRPVAALDRIIVERCLAIADCGVHHSVAASKASDHLPVWAKIHPK